MRAAQTALSALLILLVLSLAGCGGSADTLPSPPPASELHLVRNGYLTVGTDPRAPPMEFRTPRGTYAGADIDLARSLAQALGLKGVRVVPRTFDRLIPSLQHGDFDVIMAAMVDTAERRQIISFVDYMRTVLVIVVRQNSSIYAGSFPYLCGHSVAVYRYSSIRRLLAAAAGGCPKGKPLAVRGYVNGGLTEFLAGQTEAYVDTLPSGIYILHGEHGLRFAGTPILTDENTGIGVMPANDTLRRALRDALTQLMASGRYAEILHRWKISETGY